MSAPVTVTSQLPHKWRSGAKPRRKADASERHGRALSDSIFARTGSFDLSAQVLAIKCPLNTLAAP